jgi:hypothetical protein
LVALVYVACGLLDARVDAGDLRLRRIVRAAEEIAEEAYDSLLYSPW